MRPLFVCLAVALVVGAAFAETPKALFDPSVALDGRQDGAEVLWGGRVFARAEDAGDHCLEIAALPLRRSDGRPVGRDRVREGQHFIACGPEGFASASYPVRSYLTISGTLRGVKQRFVRRSCGYLLDDFGHQDFGSARRPAVHGCELALPIVDVADIRAWREDPTPASMPQ